MDTLHDRLMNLAEGFIKDYRDDLLVHDKNAMAEREGVPFLHFTGESGTIMEFLLPYGMYPPKGTKIPYLFGKADRRHILDEIKSTVFYARKSTRQGLILYYDGESEMHNLFEITQDTAEEIVGTYHKRMRGIFKAYD